MQISSITIKQLAELAFSTESVDPIDWGELSIQEEQAYIIMASHLMEQFGNVKDDEITEKYLTLMATLRT